MSKSSFPSSYSELTLEFLNKTLENIFKSKILSFKKGKEIESGFTGEVTRIIPIFSEKSENLPKSLIVKFQTTNPGINAFVAKIQGYEKEIKIYKILSSIPELNIAKVYYSDINKEGSKYIMIMEDLNERGLMRPNAEKPFNMKILKLIVEYFSKLQSSFWGPEKQKDIEWIKNNNFGEYMEEFTLNNFDNKKNFFIANNKDKLTKETIEMIRSIKIEELFDLISPSNDRNKNNTTLLHGDPQCGNLFLNDKEDKMVMIDWQYINIGLGLKDVILFIGIMLDENNIKKEDIMELKELYYKSLVKNGVNNYSRETFDEDWKNLTKVCLCNIISASAEENIGDDEEKRKKYDEHIFKAEKRIIAFIQNQNL